MNLKINIIGFFLAVCILCKGNNPAWQADTMKTKLSLLEQTVPLPFHTHLCEEPWTSTDNVFVFWDYEPIFEEILKMRNLPPELKFLPIALTEMNNDFDTNNRCGIWSLPAFVAIKYGLTVTKNHDERFDITAATNAAAAYLADLHVLYGNWWAVILAYANSPAALNAATIRHTDINLDVWDYYEMNLLNNVAIIKNFICCIYDFSVKEKTQAIQKKDSCVVIEIQKPILRSLFNDSLQITPNVLRKLNPVFRGEIIVPSDKHAFYIPHEKMDIFLRLENTLYDQTEQLLRKKKEQIPTEKQNSKSEKTYIVRAGDSLHKIAKLFGVSANDIKNRNHLNTDRINIGEKLIIPLNNSKSSTVQKTTAANSQNSNKIIHRVRKGDTLSAIAMLYHVKISDIKRWNNLKNDLIIENQRLIVYKR